MPGRSPPGCGGNLPVWSRSSVAGIIVATLAVVALTLWLLPSHADFAISNPYWNGLRAAAAALHMTELDSLSSLPASPAGTALVVIPVVQPTAAEMQQFRQYVENGGVLILLDDFGTGNAVLAGLGSQARLSGRQVIDPLFNYRAGRLPRIFDLGPGPITEGVSGLILNHATVLAETGDLIPLARSSPISFLDENGNGRRDAGEPSGPFVVAAVAPHGAGQLAVVSDPSLLVNAMLPLARNKRFVLNLARLAGPGVRVYLDGAHLPHAPLDQAKEFLARGRAALALPPVVLVATVAGIGLPFVLLSRSTRR